MLISFSRQKHQHHITHGLLEDRDIALIPTSNSKIGGSADTPPPNPAAPLPLIYKGGTLGNRWSNFLSRQWKRSILKRTNLTKLTSSAESKFARNYFAASRWAKNCDQLVGMSVYMSVCLSARICQKLQFSCHIFCTCYLLLCPPLTAVQYVMYFRFCGWRQVLRDEAKIKHDVASSSSPGGGTGGVVCRLWLHLLLFGPYLCATL